jgi:hypothetical protein
MSAKLLFVLGIIVAHGALAAGWVHQDSPRQRGAIATCVQAPDSLPDFTPPRELLALADIRAAEPELVRP